MKKIKSGILYVKNGIERYFSTESVRRYNPERSGWVRAESVDYPAPDDVVNFMTKEPVEVDVTEIKADCCKGSSCVKTNPEDSEKPKDFTEITVRELGNVVESLSDDELVEIKNNDERVSAKKIVEKEIQKRHDNSK